MDTKRNTYDCPQCIGKLEFEYDDEFQGSMYTCNECQYSEAVDSLERRCLQAENERLRSLLAELVEEADQMGGRDRIVQRVTVDRARAALEGKDNA